MITTNKINNIIRETIKFHLNEMVSPIVWHFCWIDCLVSILKSNAFELSRSEVDRDKMPGITGYSDRHPYYFCTTRSKNSGEGYSYIVSNDNQEGYVRLTLDGEKLNCIAHAKASDYFGDKGECEFGKRDLYNRISNSQRPLNKKELKQGIEDNEKEDTVWYHKPQITNANRYIIRIDILIPSENAMAKQFDKLKLIFLLAKRLGINVNLYNNQRDFDMQNNNVVNFNLKTESKAMNRRYICEDENNGKIRPTTEWMQHWYDKMNKELFNGSLGMCRLSPFTTGKGSNGDTLGWFKFGNRVKFERSSRRMFVVDHYGRKEYVTRGNFVHICQPMIELNANYVASEDSWINTLVHEMCHYYTYMDGYAPKQGHGVEFREIAASVAYRSNGTITIKRLASAEEMKDYDLDDDIRQKNQERVDRKRANTIICTVVMNDGTIRLIPTTLEKVVDSVARVHGDNIRFMGCSQNKYLISFLVSCGYRSTVRTYRYWDVTNDNDIVDAMASVKFNKYAGKFATFKEAIGMTDTDSDDTNITSKKANQSHLGYTIVQDGEGYNLVDQHKNKTFKKSVDKIWFDEDNNTFRFKMGKFTYKGTPGRWVKDDVVEETINRVIKEAIEDMVSEKTQDEGIGIIPTDVNLGLASPFELSDNNY